MIASSKHGGQNYDVSSDESRNRLFVVLPRDSSEEDLNETFSRFDGYETSYVVRNRSSGEQKGFGFVKFTKPSYAALAMESCDSAYKAVIAEPKEARSKKSDESGYANLMPSAASIVVPPLPALPSVNPNLSGLLVTPGVGNGVVSVTSAAPNVQVTSSVSFLSFFFSIILGIAAK